MDWTILTLIGAFLLVVLDAILGWNVLWLLRAIGLKKAADWLDGGRKTTPNRPF